MKRILLMLFGVLMALIAHANDFTYEYEGHTLTYTVVDENAKTCKIGPYNKVAGDLVIPEFAQGYKVVGISYSGFLRCSGLTSVIIPESVTSIDEYAFFECTDLTAVTIPNSVTALRYNAI